ncbi:MAG: AMP-binding protein, partial [Rhodocyclaceae bacterium]
MSPHHGVPTFAASASLIDVLAQRAAAQPEAPAFTFLKDGDRPEVCLSFAALERQARSLAAHLQALRLRGERALLLYPAGTDYIVAFFGCLYAGVIAVPVYPPRQNQNLLRLKAIVADARASVVLTCDSVYSRLQTEFETDAFLRGVRLMDTGAMPDRADAWRSPGVGADDIAFLQYTSGSTGTPKGVVLSHGNLLHNAALTARVLPYDDSVTAGVTWLPLYHDMGLIGGLLQPVYVGYHCVLMSPAAFLQMPLRWLKAMSDYRAAITAGPDFAYDFCTRRITAAQIDALDLSAWRIALSGAEPVRQRTLQRFAERFAPAGFRSRAFYPCYGLAEATLLVSGLKRGAEVNTLSVDEAALQQHTVAPRAGGRPLVGCGAATLPGQTVRIVDAATRRLCAPDEVGEIWLAGPSVAQGYWDNPTLSDEVFGARLAGQGGEDEGPFLRTGDLGFIADGELFITGRIKDVIILRGRNYYPQDIEASVGQIDDALKIGSCAAFALEPQAVADTGHGGEQLAVVVEVSPRQTVGAAHVAAIRSAVMQEHGVHIDVLVFVSLTAIPKTSSGKIQRSACRQRLLDGTLQVLHRWQHEASAPDPEPADASTAATAAPQDGGHVEDHLAATLAQRLGVAASTIDRHAPLSCYYIDSLAAVELVHTFEKRFGLAVPLESILAGCSIAQIAQQASPSARIARTPRNGPLPLSAGQARLWFIWQLDPQSFTYNIFDAYRVRGALDADRLSRSVSVLVERHEILRTTFEASAQGPLQRVNAPQPVPLAWVDMHGADEATLRRAIADETRRPFDLAHGPLLRLKVFRCAAHEHVVLLTLHHIVADGWSAQILIRELSAVYDGGALPAVALQYGDFARWQQTGADALAARQLAYWTHKLAGADTVLALPTDKPRPAVQNVAGDKRTIMLDAALVDALRTLAQAHNATLFMVFLAALHTLLHRYTGQHSVLVGTPISGRHRGELEDVVGFFVNTLVMRADIGASQRFSDLLEQVRQTVLDAYGHQDLPFHRLVEELKIERDLSRSPLFQVSYTYHNLKRAQLRLGDLALDPYEVDNDTTNFDLGFSMVETAGGIQCTLRYKTDLFEAATIERMLGHYRQLLQGIAQAPDCGVADLPLLTAPERALIVDAWNATGTDYGPARPVHRLFEEHARRMPQATALVFEGVQLSYAQLNARANRLAHRLIGLGVGPDVAVGVAMERSFEMVVALLAILKAGGAYVPLDPHYPAERLRYMLDDSRVTIVLTQRALATGLQQDSLRLIAVDGEEQGDNDAHFAACEGRDPTPALAGEHLAYIIYTSGSTGRPKGAMNTHAAIFNRLCWMQEAYGLRAGERVVQKTPFCFDVSVWEFFWPLMTGATLVIARPRGHMDPEYLARLIADEAV